MAEYLLALINQEGSLNFGEACFYALIGFLIVFLGITLIIFIIWFIGFILRKTNNLEFLTKIGKKKPKAVPTQVVIPETEGDIPDDVKAAIIAAIMTYYSDEKPECEFRVRRIKRI